MFFRSKLLTLRQHAYAISVPDPRGGLRGTCPPEEAKSGLKIDKKSFFHVLLKEKVGEGAQIELGPLLANDGILNPLLSGHGE